MLLWIAIAVKPPFSDTEGFNSFTDSLSSPPEFCFQANPKTSNVPTFADFENDKILQAASDVAVLLSLSLGVLKTYGSRAGSNTLSKTGIFSLPSRYRGGEIEDGIHPLFELKISNESDAPCCPTNALKIEEEYQLHFN